MKRKIAGLKSAFTLIELLAVIAIVAVLVSLLMMSFGRIRKTMERSVCGANLRQVGLAATQYAQENNGNYPLTYDLLLGVNNPVATGLIDRLASYVGGEAQWKIFYCTDVEHCVPTPPLATSLTYQAQLTSQGSDRFHLIGYYWLVSTSNQWRPDRSLPPIRLAGSGKRVLAMCPHFGGGTAHDRLYNVLFTDGHIDAIQANANGILINRVHQMATADGKEALTMEP